jgi:hypothetical protein
MKPFARSESRGAKVAIRKYWGSAAFTTLELPGNTNISNPTNSAAISFCIIILV